MLQGLTDHDFRAAERVEVASSAIGSQRALEVRSVEGLTTAALEEVGHHRDAEAEGQRDHQDEAVAPRLVLGRHRHPRDEDLLAECCLIESFLLVPNQNKMSQICHRYICRFGNQMHKFR